MRMVGQAPRRHCLRCEVRDSRKEFSKGLHLVARLNCLAFGVLRATVEI